MNSNRKQISGCLQMGGGMNDKSSKKLLGVMSTFIIFTVLMLSSVHRSVKFTELCTLNMYSLFCINHISINFLKTEGKKTPACVDIHTCL